MARSMVQVDGLKRLQADLRRAGAGMDDLKDANAKVATLVATEAGARAPRRTGTLAGTGRGSRAAGKATVVFGSARVRYAGPLHWGWPARGIAAHPFAVDAALATQPEWMDLYAEELQAVADKVAGTY